MNGRHVARDGARGTAPGSGFDGLGVADAEVHLFIFGDIAAADAAYRQMDAGRLRPLRASTARGTRPQALINNNMLVIVLGGDEALRRRIAGALTPGTENRQPDDVEP